MFGTRANLETLRLRKEVLVLQCDTQRLLLTAQYRQFREPQFWLNNAGRSAREHPVLATAVSLGAGLVAVQLLRKPRTIFKLLGNLGGLTSTALSAWKTFRRQE